MPASGFWRSGDVFFGKRVHLENIKTGLTATAGGGQTSALALTATVNVVSTVASAGDSVKLPVAYKGAEILIKNTAASNSMDVFPQTGGTIDGGSANAAKAQEAGTGRRFICVAVAASTGYATWVTF